MPEIDYTKLTTQTLKAVLAHTNDNIHETCVELNQLQERYKVISDELKNRGA